LRTNIQCYDKFESFKCFTLRMAKLDKISNETTINIPIVD
jgi:hypothetical protein